jgi:hypothetical protein
MYAGTTAFWRFAISGEDVEVVDATELRTGEIDTGMIDSSHSTSQV